jgi:hypothetical protein
MPNQDGRRLTEPVHELLLGNELFERTVAAVDLDGNMVRPLLAQVLGPLGSTPREVTPDELGMLIPEIERRLRMAVPSDAADSAVKKMLHVLLAWGETEAE